MRRKSMAPRSQFTSQVRVVINLAVEHNSNRAILVEDRLPASAEINDAQPTMTETDIVFNEVAVIVGTAMRLGRRHAFQECATDRISCVEIDYPADPAHRLSLPVLRVRSGCRFPKNTP